MKRFELMGEINPKFIEETNAYLEALQITDVQEFKNLLSRCVLQMRRLILIMFI